MYIYVTAALFTPAEMWKQPKYPSTEKWIHKMQSIHTREGSGLKKAEETTTWTK